MKTKKMAFGGLGKVMGGKAQPAPPAPAKPRNVGASIAAAMRRNAEKKASQPALATPSGPFGGKSASQKLAELKASRGMKKGGAVKKMAAKRGR